MNTTHLQLLRHCYIFQPGCVLALPDPVSADAGYVAPDIGDGTSGIIPRSAVRLVADFNEEPEGFLGRCILTRVTNFFRNEEEKASPGSMQIGEIRPEHVQVIHYAESQQLVFHMPQYAYDAGRFMLTNDATGEVLENVPVREKLSGGTMIVVDTLPLKSGFYTLEAYWPGGWTHQIKFIKFIAGFPNAAYENQPMNISRALHNKEAHLVRPEIYRASEDIEVPAQRPVPKGYIHPPGNVTMIQNDGGHRIFDSNGVEIEDGVDTEAFLKSIADKFGRSLDYTQDGRGGTINYREGDMLISFGWEFAGGNGVVIILIPEEKYWVAATRTPLNRRTEILTFVAQQVIRDKAPSCVFEIYSNTISILRR